MFDYNLEFFTHANFPVVQEMSSVWILAGLRFEPIKTKKKYASL